jgi:hypothetical protein
MIQLITASRRQQHARDFKKVRKWLVAQRCSYSFSSVSLSLSETKADNIDDASRCVYRKLKPARNGDEAHQGLGVN